MDKPVCGEKWLDGPFCDPDVCFEECMLEDEPTDDYAYEEPEYSYVYEKG